MTQTPRSAAVESITSLRQHLLESTPTVGIDPSAVSGRVLANTIDAPAADPATDRATMDGFAIATADEYPLTVRREEVYPEDEQPSMDSGEAVPVATGGRLPARADAVLKREDAEVREGPEGNVQIRRGNPLESGENVYERGSNVAADETLFRPGERLLPKDAVLLDDLGVDELLVRQRWSVGVLATGTEIHEGSSPDRDSHMLVALASSWGHEATHEGSVPDNLDRVRERVHDLAHKHDVIITSGGTSVGSRDYLVRTLEDLGDVLVHGVRTRPGKSTAVARLPEAAVIALPGRPVACHAAALLFSRPLLTGRTDFPGLSATADLEIDLGPDGECVIPVNLVGGERGQSDGQPRARPIDAEADAASYTFRPSTLSSMTRATRADGFVLTDEPISADEAVSVIPFAGVERS